MPRVVPSPQGTELGSGIYGDSLAGNLGIQSYGLRELGRPWLVSWNSEVDLALGGVASEHPFDWLYGASGEAHGEGGWRALPGRPWSPYLVPVRSALPQFG